MLLVEDDAAVRQALGLALTHLGHAVTVAADGEQGLAEAVRLIPDVVVLDVMLPGLDGFEVCRRLRARGTTPVIMLTARTDDVDVVVGLEAGADDYVAKPVQPRVLDARIKAVLRRTVVLRAPREHHGTLTVDRSSLRVTRGGELVELSPTELRLLLVVSERPGQVFSREQLLQAVWEQDYLGDSRLVDACVQRLRAKIEQVPASPVLLQTVRGFGYRFGLL